MEALFLPFLAISLLVIVVYGFRNNQPALEEDEVRAVRPLLRLLRRSEEGLAEDDPALRPFAPEVAHALAKGYIRRSGRGLLVLTEVGDRLRRTGKLTAASA
ncbi:hypothetical protein [Phenylobacterium sp.]|uniref:hypothetical protein n=1 Tax=Phenylobacterium sp. TaxID=1871053 RepID=UPI0025CF3555|nr:hypothetical protein [Phenylobacterium sp.]